MKIYRIATFERTIDIYLPNILMWFFKRFVKIRSIPPLKNLQGSSLDSIVFDEFKETKEGV